MSVQRRDRHLVQPLTHSRVFCVYTGCLSKDVTGSLYSLFLGFFALTQCICPRTWQVTVLFTALLYQGPLFIWLLCFLFISLLLFAFTQCVCPKTWQVTVLFTALLYQGPSFNLIAFTQCVCPKTWQVTVLYLTALPRSLFLPEHFVSSRLFCLFSGLLFFSHSVCPKTWQVTVLFTPLSGYTVYLS